MLAWPLPFSPKTLPPVDGMFGTARKHDIHTGIDLYAADGEMVVSIGIGRVINVQPFTGPDAGSPWWLPTDAVLVETKDGIILYGEVSSLVDVGENLVHGEPIGIISRVLRHDKGRPTSMLHLEYYDPGVKEACEPWKHGEE